MEEYPREVQGHPLLLASLVGATAIHQQLTEALHEVAVNACGQRRFKYLSSSYDMRILPAKRGARDNANYRIEGILKRSWLEKMCGTIPAVLVLCIDWSEELSQPEQEESQALHYLQHAQRQAKERDLRLVLFVLLHAKTADPEAACSALHSEHDRNATIVAMGMEDLAAKVPSLERLIYKNAIAFYADEEKRLRKAWNPKVPNTAMQIAMQVRTNFKAAFLNEFRKDARGSLTAYVKAYEQLLKESDIIDFLERMDLCNHITLRMWQRYFSSHDVGAAVHHCRVHVSSLKKCCSENSEYVWRKNHQIFGDLLDTIAQKVPLLIDHSDIWQFPGFHFQSAAIYARRLREWAIWCLQPGHLPLASNAGGELLPSPFVGQAGNLERPSEVSVPKDEVALRLAWEQAKNHQVHTERSLKLMIRAQAAAKERNLTSWIASSQVRVAETYLCDHGSSHQQAALDFFERLRKQPSGSSCCSSWAPFRRFFLERSILCGCTQLGLPPPAVCSSTRDAPTILDTESNPTDALRINLAKDAFEYLSLAYVPAWNDKRQGDELLKLVAKATLPLPAASIEIPLLQPGRLTSELLGFNLTFDTSGLAVPLELQGCILQEDGPKGHVETTMDSEVRNWEVGQPLSLTSLPANVSQVRLTWAASSAVIFVGSGKACLPLDDLKLKLPGADRIGLPEHILQSLSGDGNREMIKSNLLFPIDPSKALVSETFIFYLSLHPAHFTSTRELRLTAHVQVLEEDKDSTPSHPLESSRMPRISLISDTDPLDFVPLGDGQQIAEVGQELKPTAGFFTLKPGELQRPGHTDAFAWPIAVQCGRACKMTLSFTLSANTPICRPSVCLTFQHAMKLQIAEEKMSTSLAFQRPVSFALKSLFSAVETTSVEVFLNDTERNTCLGKPSVIACGSAHAFLWPPPANTRFSQRPRLSVEFHRHKAIEIFFQWIEASKRPSKIPGGGVAEWLLPVPVADGDGMPLMQVELEVSSTGMVGTPMLVRVRLKHSKFSDEEIKVRILQEGEVSDRYLLSGPVSYQAAVTEAMKKADSEAIQSFSLIPLKAGWLSLPKVQVTWAGQDATSCPGSVFVSPATKPAVWRTQTG